ncbi:MAG: RdgB/HAM1 family non-canonical purine NTP pyrophosphatase [Spirosomaceae bacterium]|nr:RdgB/HAM1 family non-canonical purine NTP pyrophosphatase [Spirosomataceae bacterium]
MTICLATNNAHKVEELQQMLGDKFTIKTLADIGFTDEIEETETTFQGNSRLKARHVYDKFQLTTIADDSGLEVEALNGEPGIYSARYAGEHGNHAKNNAKLLTELAGKTNRNAQFRSVITLIHDNEETQFEGIVKGKINEELSGTDGFGYDPLFTPEGFDRTFAEMTMEEKNPISHRGLAVEKLINHLKEI